MANDINRSGGSYVGAPYNFVPFYNSVVPVKEEAMSVHHLIQDDLLTGEISYTVKSETPIFISDGQKENPHFVKNERGEYIIPGSTMRGLIRNNVQILGLSSFDDDIDDYELMFRTIANGTKSNQRKYNHDILQNAMITVSDDGKQMGVPSAVKAGYIENKNGKYTIYPAVEHLAGNKDNQPYNMSYYVLSERYIINHMNKFPFFTEPGNEKYLSYKPGCRFYREEQIKVKGSKTLYYRTDDPDELEKALIGDTLHYEGKTEEKKIIADSIGKSGSNKVDVCRDKEGKILKAIHYVCDKNQKNGDFRPFYKAVAYHAGKNQVSNLSSTSKAEQNMLNGCLLSSGPMDEKKALYLIPEIDEAKEAIPVPLQDVKAFEIDYNRKEKGLKQEKNVEDKAPFFALPIENERKPVFFIEHGSRLYFGFTPRLRLFYDHKVKDGYRQRPSAFDYAKSLFGMSKGNDSYKSKVSFSDAVICTKPEEQKQKKVLLAEPKPSSYLDYLKQTPGKIVTYNEKFELRGVKQYWLHHDTVEPDTAVKNDKVYTRLRPLDQAEFTGKVRFQNLSRAELGLLLWSIKLEEDSEMNVGMAKPYGYGAVKVSDVAVKVLDNSKAYDLAAGLDFNPFRPEDSDKLISEYKAEIEKKLGGRKIDDLAHIKAFFAMKDASEIPDDYWTKYMVIDKAKSDPNRKKEYQARNNAGASLPEISEVSGKKAPERTDDTISVILTEVNPDNKNKNKFVGRFKGGLVFDVPRGTQAGTKVRVKVTKDTGKMKFCNFLKTE